MKRLLLGGLAAAIAVAAVAIVGASELGSSARSRGVRVVAYGAGTDSARITLQPPRVADPNAPGLVIARSDRLDLPDPFILAADGEYYMYLSTAFDDPTHSNVPLLVGGPGQWEQLPDALPHVPSWSVPASAGGKVWDPYVIHLGSRYVMYFAPQLSGIRTATHCLGIAVSSSPAGPFVPVPGPPIVCQIQLGGDIDAQVFFDPSGPDGPSHPLYLIWKSDNNNLAGSSQTTIWAAPLTNDGLEIAGPFVKIFSAGQSWEEPVLEAPQMVKAPDGTDWLFFSAGTGFFTPRYAIGAAECAGPLGGCHDVFSGPLIASNSQGTGPGEETVFVAPGGSTWLLYSPWHTEDPIAPLRPVEAARIGWNTHGPYVATAGTFPSPLVDLGLHLFSPVSAEAVGATLESTGTTARGDHDATAQLRSRSEHKQ